MNFTVASENFYVNFLQHINNASISLNGEQVQLSAYFITI